MIKAETGRGRGVKVIAAGSALEMVGDVLNIIQAIYCSMLKLHGGEQQAEMFRCQLAIGLRPGSPVWRPIQGEDATIVAQGGAAEALARAFERGAAA